MPDGITVELRGLAELKAKLEQLATQDAEAAVMKALRAGAVVEQAAISEAAPLKDSTGGLLPDGALKSDIVVTAHRPKNRSAYVTVGPGKYTRSIARLVEYGHRLVRGGRSQLLKNGKTRGPGKQIGMVPEHPFIRPAFEASRQAVADAIGTTLITEVEAAAARKGK